MNTFLLKRQIDLSLLTNGFHIPVIFHPLVYSLYGRVSPGEKLNIKVLIDNEIFEAKLYNINFDRTRYPDHPDLLQIRYTPSSKIAKKLQAIFSQEYDFLLKERTVRGSRKQIKLPKENNSHIVLYGTSTNGLFILECNTVSNLEDLKSNFLGFTEEEFELFTPLVDESAAITEKSTIQRVRKLDKSIGNSLKQLYEYHCQMTGETIGEKYGVSCVEAHHIIPFTESLNNDTSNIIIVSPSYHRIIHKAKPIFNREKLAFEFPNGIIDKVKLDKHLRL